MNVDVSENRVPFIRSQVLSGKYSPEGEVLEKALSSLERSDAIHATSATGIGLIGALREDAELLDQALDHAMKIREERP